MLEEVNVGQVVRDNFIITFLKLIFLKEILGTKTE